MFDLNTLRVGRGAVMRSATRLLSGAEMRPFSTMLEHTLVVRRRLRRGRGAGAQRGRGRGWPAAAARRSAAALAPTTPDRPAPLPPNQQVSGDLLPAGTTWQGWPAQMVQPNLPTLLSGLESLRSGPLPAPALSRALSRALSGRPLPAAPSGPAPTLGATSRRLSTLLSTKAYSMRPHSE